MKSNVIFILIDDLGWRDLSCYGSTFYETPHLDQLAREGMQFTDAYAAYEKRVSRFFPSTVRWSELALGGFSFKLWLKNKEYWSIVGTLIIFSLLLARYHYFLR